MPGRVSRGALRARRPDQGAGSVEYIVVILLVALIVASLATSGVGATVARTTAAAVDCVYGARTGPGCEGDAPEPRGGPGGDPSAERPVNPAPESYECGFAQLVCDFGQGMGEEASDLVADAWEGVRGTGCLVHLCRHEEFRGTWGGVRDSTVQVFTDPKGALEDAWNTVTDGPYYGEAWDDENGD